jgi:hypothetical protein
VMKMQKNNYIRHLGEKKSSSRGCKQKKWPKTFTACPKICNRWCKKKAIPVPTTTNSNHFVFFPVPASRDCPRSRHEIPLHGCRTGLPSSIPHGCCQIRLFTNSSHSNSSHSGRIRGWGATCGGGIRRSGSDSMRERWSSARRCAREATEMELCMFLVINDNSDGLMFSLSLFEGIFHR